MNIYPDIFNILATHLEMDEKGRGRYQNKFLPPEKVEILLKDLYKRIGEEIEEREKYGRKEMLVEFIDLFEHIVDDAKKEVGLGYTYAGCDEAKLIKNFLNWKRNRKPVI